MNEVRRRAWKKKYDLAVATTRKEDELVLKARGGAGKMG